MASAQVTAAPVLDHHQETFFGDGQGLVDVLRRCRSTINRELLMSCPLPRWPLLRTSNTAACCSTFNTTPGEKNKNWLVVYLPLWKLLVSWDDYSQYMENKSHVPKHQPAMIPSRYKSSWDLNIQLETHCPYWLGPDLEWASSTHAGTLKTLVHYEYKVCTGGSMVFPMTTPVI